jgi:hypothetical protein
MLLFDIFNVYTFTMHRMPERKDIYLGIRGNPESEKDDVSPKRRLTMTRMF